MNRVLRPRHLGRYAVFPISTARIRLRRDQRCHGMSGPLWRVLHRAVDLFVDTGDAAGEAGGREVRAVVAGFQVCDFRKTGATGGVQESAAERIDVRRECGGCAGVPHAA